MARVTLVPSGPDGVASVTTRLRALVGSRIDLGACVSHDDLPEATARTSAGGWKARVGDAELPDVDPVPSWDEIATRYGRAVYTMAYRLTGDADEARDLSQDVFVRVYRNLDKYRPGTFEGWLYRITKNLFLDRVRRRRRVRLEPLPDEEWSQPTDADPGPDEHLERGLLRGDIELAILELPPAFRTAVVLCDVQGLSYEEVARATGWPLGTVRSRIHRGRRQLRAALTRGHVDVAGSWSPGDDRG